MVLRRGSETGSPLGATDIAVVVVLEMGDLQSGVIPAFAGMTPVTDNIDNFLSDTKTRSVYSYGATGGAKSEVQRAIPFETRSSSRLPWK